MPVSVFLTSMGALGTTAPAGSATVPVIVPRSLCASAHAAKTRPHHSPLIPIERSFRHQSIHEPLAYSADCTPVCNSQEIVCQARLGVKTVNNRATGLRLQ